jgi:hypothetical protein
MYLLYSSYCGVYPWQREISSLTVGVGYSGAFQIICEFGDILIWVPRIDFDRYDKGLLEKFEISGKLAEVIFLHVKPNRWEDLEIGAISPTWPHSRRHQVNRRHGEWNDTLFDYSQLCAR